MARGRPSRLVVYARLENAVDVLFDRYGGLPSSKEAEYVWSDIWHLEAHNSTALEGNTLVLREVATLLDEGRAVGAKPLREYMEVKGYGDAAQWVYAHAREPDDWSTDQLVTIHDIRQVHELAMTPVWNVAPHPDATDRERPGSFREHDIHPFSKGMTPPSWPLVPARLQDWVDLVNSSKDDLHRRSTDAPWPELLAKIHNTFEQVHPFLDGNGRTGRLLLNLVLVKLSYPPIVVLKREREHYLKAMQRADIEDYGPLGELLARAIYDNLNRFILPAVAGPARMVPLAALVTKDISHAALRQAAQRGRLDAVQGSDGIWRSSQIAVRDYLKTKQH